MRELDRQDNGLFKCLLRRLQTRHIFPLDVRLLRENRTRERSPQLLALSVIIILVLPTRPVASRPIVPHRSRFPFIAVLFFDMLLQLLRSLHVLAGLAPDHVL